MAALVAGHRDLTLVRIAGDALADYPVDLERCLDSANMLDWILQLDEAVVDEAARPDHISAGAAAWAGCGAAPSRSRAFRTQASQRARATADEPAVQLPEPA